MATRNTGSVGDSVLVGTVLIVVRSVLVGTAQFEFRSVLVGTAEAWPTVGFTICFVAKVVERMLGEGTIRSEERRVGKECRL